MSMSDVKLGNPIVEHRKRAGKRANVAVITLSSTRSIDNDQSGDLIQERLEKSGHAVILRKVIADSRGVLRATLRELIRQKELHAIITTGGTGIAGSDITVETVRSMLDKELPGFTALFMLLSYPKAKSAAMLSRTLAGIIKGKAVFCLPGSPRACQLAVDSLIIPELGHMLMLAGS